MIKRNLFIFCLLVLQFGVFSQNKVIDEIVAVVGNKPILLSDIENQYLQFVAQGSADDTTVKCQILEEIILSKLLVNQAELDSVTVNDAQVEDELDRRIRYFVAQIGSQDKMEAYFGKTLFEIKTDLRESIKDMLITQTMQSKITGDIKVTPSEVRSFFKKLPKDSIPLVEAEFEVGQIVKQPSINKEEIDLVKEKLNSFRQRIINGEDFNAIAILYSEDVASAKKGGELGFYGRGHLYPEFEAAAFSLKGKEISPIVKTKAGYHIIQLIERRGDQINVRHILLKPKPATDALYKAKLSLDSIATAINSGTITFDAAARKFSDDPTKTNGGIMVNSASGTSKFEADDFDKADFYVIDKLKIGEISKPTIMETEDGDKAYRIFYLKSKSEPHLANLNDDYSYIQKFALAEKQNTALNNWIAKMKKNTFIDVSKKYQYCMFNYKWLN